MIKLQNAKEPPSLYAYYLAQNIFVKGSAEYIADNEKMDQNGAFVKEQSEHFGVNNYRMAEDFYLIERTLIDEFKNPEKVDVDAY